MGSPRSNPRRNLTTGDFLAPFILGIKIITFQLWIIFLIAVFMLSGNQYTSKIFLIHPWFTESYAFLTSIHATERFVLPV